MMARFGRLGAERRQVILRHVREKGSASIAEISEVAGASLATVHRDLEQLADQGAITRVRGGALALDADDPPVSTERARQVPEKQAIAKAAAAMVDGRVASIFLEASTTVQLLVPHLARLPEKVFVTNGPEIALELVAAQAEVILIGGELRARTLASVGQLAIQALESVVIDLAFLGVSAIDENGLSSMNLSEAETKSAIMSRASVCVALCDGAKLGRRALAPVGPLEGIQTLVTDSSAPPQELARLREAGLNVVVVQNSPVRKSPR